MIISEIRATIGSANFAALPLNISFLEAAVSVKTIGINKHCVTSSSDFKSYNSKAPVTETQISAAK
jgi:hypothetical protein